MWDSSPAPFTAFDNTGPRFHPCCIMKTSAWIVSMQITGAACKLVYYNLSVGPIKRYAIISLVHLTINKVPSALSSHHSLQLPLLAPGPACLPHWQAQPRRVECLKCCKMQCMKRKITWAFFRNSQVFIPKPGDSPGLRCPLPHPELQHLSKCCRGVSQRMGCLRPLFLSFGALKAGGGWGPETTDDLGGWLWAFPSSCDTCIRMCFLPVLCLLCCSTKSCAILT